MALNLITVLIIKDEGNDIRCQPYIRDDKTNKWSGAINLYREGIFDRILVTSQPILDSTEDAVSYMEDIVEKIRAVEISKKK
jgi:hypothetical protein